jgi:hypothetical protein
MATPHTSPNEARFAPFTGMNATNVDTALVFVELENIGAEPIMLTGAEILEATAGTRAGFRMQDAKGGYVDLGAEMPVTPVRLLVLSPRGLAIRLAGLARGLEEGDTFEVHLETSLGELAVVVASETADAQQYSHAGHAH